MTSRVIRAPSTSRVLRLGISLVDFKTMIVKVGEGFLQQTYSRGEMSCENMSHGMVDGCCGLPVDPSQEQLVNGASRLSPRQRVWILCQNSRATMLG